MRLALATAAGDPLDVRVWSATPSHLATALLGQPIALDLLGPLDPVAVFLGRALASTTRRVGRRTNWEVEPLVLRRLTRRLGVRTRALRPDVILCPGWTPYPAVSLPAPAVYWGDATYAQRLEISPHWTGLSKRTTRLVHELEGRILAQFAGIVMPSEWARSDVIDRYGYPPHRIATIPFGAELVAPRHKRPPATSGALRLLLVGVEWERKGIDVAVLFTDELRRRGIPAELDVAGVLPPDASWERTHVRYHGFLAKDDPIQRERLSRLFDHADIFVLPSRSDPSPVVLAEAAAHSLPAVAAAVGGIPERIVDGQTGLIVDPGASPEQWASVLERLFSDGDLLLRMGANARRMAEENADWNRSVERMLTFVQGILDEQDDGGSVQ